MTHERLVEAVFLSQESDLVGVNGFTLTFQFGNVGFEIVAGWELNDDEYDKTDHQQGGDHHQQPLYHITDHSNQNKSGR